jgi:hypothetical protein
METVKDKALDYLRRAGTMQPITFGIPANVPKPSDNDTTMSESVMSSCQECGVPIWSTVVKEKIRELAPQTIFVCVTCLQKYMALPHDVYYTHKPNEPTYNRTKENS